MPIELAETALTPPVFLAPLAGITDLPFRNLVSGYGAGLVVSEMVASQDIVQERASARDRAELGLTAANTSVQLAGRDAYWMSEAARLVESNGAQMIDINMGCPAKKVTSGYSGAALLKDLDHALKLIEAVVEAVSVPVTLKTRLGWNDDLITAPTLARRAEDAGIQMIVVHGRTRCQFYKGHANWVAIRAVKDAVSIPVIANGDIVDTASAARALAASGADGVMIGRGAQGAPWVLAQVAANLNGAPPPQTPTGRALVDLVLAHHAEMLRFYGPELGLKIARKHLGWYMDGAGTPADLRKRVLTERVTSEVTRLLQDALAFEVAA